jgi:hypothetical protein
VTRGPGGWAISKPNDPHDRQRDAGYLEGRELIARDQTDRERNHDGGRCDWADHAHRADRQAAVVDRKTEQTKDA